MKGVIFCEFLEMVEDQHSYDVVDAILVKANFEHKGAYTAIDNYPAEEMMTLIANLEELTNQKPQIILESLGHRLFNFFRRDYPHFFHSDQHPFTFLTHIESYIHVEVKKLYPTAELPTFTTINQTENTLVLKYQSERKLYHLAKGLIEALLKFYKYEGNVQLDVDAINPEICLITIDIL